VLAVSNYRFEIRSHHAGNAADFRVAPKLVHGRSFLVPAIAEGFDLNVRTDLASILETICDCFCGIVDFDLKALDRVRFNAADELQKNA
jgi:hypothetical protein